MSQKWTGEVFFQRGLSAAFALSLAALLAAPAWAQRGGRGQPMRMSPPPMSMPRMRRPMRPAPRPMGPRERMPRYNSPFRPLRPVFRARPPMRRMPMPASGSNSITVRGRIPASAGRHGKFRPNGNRNAPPRAFVPGGAEGVRIPVYTPMTSRSYRYRVSATKSIQNSYSSSRRIDPRAPYWNLSATSGSGYTYPWNSAFPSAGFFVDPFDYAFFSGAGCFGFSSFNNLGFFPYSAQFAYPLFGPSLFCGDMFSTDFLNPLCPLCNTLQFDLLALGFNLGLNNYGFLDTLSASTRSTTPLSRGSLNSLIATSSTGSSLTGNFYGGSAFSSAIPPVHAGAPRGASPRPALSDSAFNTNQAARTEPLTLVFHNGFRIEATQYWLGNDGNLHYVASDGAKMSTPLGLFDIPATMAANHQEGVQLLAPASRGPAPAATNR